MNGIQSSEPPLSLRHSTLQNESNLGLTAATNYHEALDGFLPLFHLVLDLSPQFVSVIAQGNIAQILISFILTGSF